MKKHFLILIITLFSFNGMGQVWIDSGAVWHYDFWAVGWHGFIKYEHEKDTVIEGRSCMKITGEQYVFTYWAGGVRKFIGIYKYPAQYTYVSGDTVFYWNNGEFFVLYNFGASIGDSWVVSLVNPGSWPCDDTSRIIVTDTGHININSVNYRYITIEPTSNSSVGMKGTYVERFGNIDSVYGNFQDLFPYGYECDSIGAIVEWNFLKFKCYQDSSFALYNPSGQDCEYYLTTIGIEEKDEHPFRLYPNPTTGLVNISHQYGTEKSVDVYNYQGRLLKSVRLHGESNTIDISDLPRGVYLLSIQAESGGMRVFKVVRE